MKKYLIIIALAAFVGCDDDGISNDQPGCVTGIYVHDDTNKVVTIGCGTQEQYGNFAIIRVDYQDLKWTPVNSCDECK